MASQSDWEEIDDGSWNGVKKYIRGTDDDHGSVQVRYEGHDAETIIDQNKRDEGFDRKSDMWHVGHIPASVGLKWLVEEGLDLWNPAHQDGIARKLMDSDYRYLVPGMRKIIF
jgi:hypothetical protein